MIYRGPETDAPPSEEEQSAMGEFMGEMIAKGWLLAADGLRTSAHGSRVRQANGEVKVIDGPFSEAKEIVGGFAIVDVPTKEIALGLAKKFLKVAGDGESEVRLMHDIPAYPPA
jgi:hypothetical protein